MYISRICIYIKYIKNFGYKLTAFSFDNVCVIIYIFVYMHDFIIHWMTLEQ